MTESLQTAAREVGGAGRERERETKSLLSDQIRALGVRRPHEPVGSDGETDRLMLIALQTLVERFEALEGRVPTNEQLAFLTARMEDQKWQLETWRRLTRWSARLLAVMGAFGLAQSLGWKPVEALKHFFGIRS